MRTLILLFISSVLFAQDALKISDFTSQQQGRLGQILVHKGTAYFLLDQQLNRINGTNLEQPLGDTPIEAIFADHDRLFIARDGKLFEFDGTDEILIGTHANIAQLAVYGDDLVALQQNEEDLQLVLIQDSHATLLSSQAQRGLLQVIGQHIYFQRDGRPYANHGQAEQAIDLLAGNPALKLVEPLSVTVFGEQLILMIQDGQLIPYLSSGTAQTTYPLTRSRLWSSDTSSLTHHLVHHGDQVYFSMGHQVWSTSKVESETAMAFELPQDLQIQGLFRNSSGFLIFARNESGFQFWRSRGDQGNTYKLMDLENVDPSEALISDDILYFKGQTSQAGTELMRTDGTSGGTYSIDTIMPGAGSSIPRLLTAAGSQVVFLALSDDHGEQVYALCNRPDTNFQVEGGCEKDIITVRVPDAGIAASYEWELSGAKILESDGPMLRFQAGKDNLVLSLTINHSGGCFASNQMTLSPLNNSPSTEPTVDGPSETCASQRDLTFQVTNAEPDVEYLWTVPVGVTIIAGQGSNRLVASWGDTSGDITVRASNACGEGLVSNHSVTVNTDSPTLDAGPNQTLCGTSTSLAATIDAPYSGRWSVLEGQGGSFSDSADPNATFNGQAGREYRLRWEVDEPFCGPIYDEVRVTFTSTATANAGMDQTTCESGSARATLGAYLPNGATGSWTILSGEGGWIFEEDDPTTQFYGVSGTTYELQWTVDFGLCGIASDTVSITLNTRHSWILVEQNLPRGVATPLITRASHPIGTWTIVDGPDTDIAQFADINDPQSLFTPSSNGIYELYFSITPNSCGSGLDAITKLYVDEPQHIPFGITAMDNITQVIPNPAQFDSSGNLIFQVNRGFDYPITLRTDGHTTDIISHINGTVYMAGDRPIYKVGNNLYIGDDHDVRRAYDGTSTIYYAGQLAGHPAFANSEEFVFSDGTLSGTLNFYTFPGGNARGVTVINDRPYFIDDVDGTPYFYDMGTSPEEVAQWGAFPSIVNAGAKVHALGIAMLVYDDRRVYFSPHFGADFVRDTNAGTYPISATPNRIFVSSINQIFSYTETGKSARNYIYDELLGNNGSHVIFRHGEDLYAADGENEATLLGTGFNPALLRYVRQLDGMVTFEYNYAFWKSDGTPAGTVELTRSPNRPREAYVDMGGTYIYVAATPNTYNQVQITGYSPVPSLRLQAAEALCTRAEQEATLTGVGKHADVRWQIGGGFFTETPKGHSVRYVPNGTGVVTLNAEVFLPGHVSAAVSKVASADPAPLHNWGGDVDVRDLVLHFAACGQ